MDEEAEAIALITETWASVPLGLYRVGKTNGNIEMVIKVERAGPKVVAIINPALGPELSQDFAVFFATAQADIEYLLNLLKNK